MAVRIVTEAGAEPFWGFALDVDAGLSSRPKYLKPKYFYDHFGSVLFDQICLQPEYYPTRTESGILRKYSDSIAEIYGNMNVVVELGSGSAAKTRILLESLMSTAGHVSYFPIDISLTALQQTVTKLVSEFPNLNVRGIAADYYTGLKEAAKHVLNNPSGGRKIILFLGSSIGNFEPEEAKSLLCMIKDAMNKNDLLLIGFDLHKNKKLLTAAYNDEAGITAKFNLNLLDRINNVLLGQFDLDSFYHYAFYNENLSRIEMHLVSLCKQHVRIERIGRSFSFEEGESIQTENSYKYTLPQIESLTRNCGLEVEQHYLDQKGWFDLALISKSGMGK